MSLFSSGHLAVANERERERERDRDREQQEKEREKEREQREREHERERELRERERERANEYMRAGESFLSLELVQFWKSHSDVFSPFSIGTCALRAFILKHCYSKIFMCVLKADRSSQSGQGVEVICTPLLPHTDHRMLEFHSGQASSSQRVSSPLWCKLKATLGLFSSSSLKIFCTCIFFLYMITFWATAWHDNCVSHFFMLKSLLVRLIWCNGMEKYFTWAHVSANIFDVIEFLFSLLGLFQQLYLHHRVPPATVLQLMLWLLWWTPQLLLHRWTWSKWRRANMNEMTICLQLGEHPACLNSNNRRQKGDLCIHRMELCLCQGVKPIQLILKALVLGLRIRDLKQSPALKRSFGLMERRLWQPPISLMSLSNVR